MSIHFSIKNHTEIAVYTNSLLDLEKSIRYPIDDGNDYFTIIHGKNYHPFFSSMGITKFLIAFDEEEVIGSAAGTWKKITFGDKKYTGLYVSDLKLSSKYRGKTIPAKMAWYAFRNWLINKSNRGWDFLFYAAMQKKSGDVNRSFIGLHLGRLVKPFCVFDIYFIEPEKLLKLTSPPPLPSGIINLSENKQNNIEWNIDKKEFILQSTGKPWILAHLPSLSNISVVNYFTNAGEAIIKKDPNALACFALDNRITEWKDWLQKNGIQSETTCVMYALSFSGFSINRKSKLLSISTAEI
jgi:hypothetical protein